MLPAEQEAEGFVVFLFCVAPDEQNPSVPGQDKPKPLQSLAPAHGSQSGGETSVESSGLLPPPSSKPSASLTDTQTLSFHSAELQLPFCCYSFYNWEKKCFLILCIYLAALFTGPNPVLNWPGCPFDPQDL